LPGILLDTHVLYWLVRGDGELSEESLVAIGENQQAGTLFVSPITAWELSVATQKKRVIGRPHLGDDTPERWFRAALRAAAARIIPIRQRIAYEAAKVARESGHRDPGDCFLMATARVHRIPLVTRDELIRSIAAELPAYLTVINC
jgi:PIN domain nuclease of toxin-antitoxin system